MKRLKSLILFVILVSFFSCKENPVKTDTSLTENIDAKGLFTKQCASCHTGNGSFTAPSLIHLGAMTPRSIVSALELGKMQVQGASLSRNEKIAMAEMLTEMKFTEGTTPPNMCEDANLKLSNVTSAGWGGNNHGTGYVLKDNANLTATEVPDLKLKWAFGFEGGTATRSIPTVIDNSIIFNSEFGEIYCLNMQTGCVQWIYQADGNVRGGIAVRQNSNGETTVFFADFNCKVYALNANSGELLWSKSVRNEAPNSVTGTVAYADGMVYIPLSSMEVSMGSQELYECCKGSGMVVAVNAENGNEVWRHRVVQEESTAQTKSSTGVTKYGPSGAPVWSSPTVDEKRGLLYIGTGENNSYPTTNSSDALQALNLKTGELVWTYQATSGDAYVTGTFNEDGTKMETCANCPDPTGPDVDFGMAPVLTTNQKGLDVLIVGQKSGEAYSLDPETGQPIWKKRLGRGGALGGIHWGIATDGKVAYVPISDWFAFGGDSSYPASPGLYALDVMSGEVLWKSVPDFSLCEGKPGCITANSAAPTLIDGVVFAGNIDGHIRAHDAATGNVIWDYNTAQDYETVNGVKAHGGSIDGPGPVIANGMVFVSSGYGKFGQMGGNVLLAFEAE